MKEGLSEHDDIGQGVRAHDVFVLECHAELFGTSLQPNHHNSSNQRRHLPEHHFLILLEFWRNLFVFHPSIDEEQRFIHKFNHPSFLDGTSCKIGAPIHEIIIPDLLLVGEFEALELSALRKDNDAISRRELLVEFSLNMLMILQQHPEIVIFVDFALVIDHCYWQNHDNQQQYSTHYSHMVFLPHQG